jgi:hypothetical protein
MMDNPRVKRIINHEEHEGHEENRKNLIIKNTEICKMKINGFPLKKGD